MRSRPGFLFAMTLLLAMVLWPSSPGAHRIGRERMIEHYYKLIEARLAANGSPAHISRESLDLFKAGRYRVAVFSFKGDDWIEFGFYDDDRLAADAALAPPIPLPPPHPTDSLEMKAIKAFSRSVSWDVGMIDVERPAFVAVCQLHDDQIAGVRIMGLEAAQSGYALYRGKRLYFSVTDRPISDSMNILYQGPTGHLQFILSYIPPKRGRPAESSTHTYDRQFGGVNQEEERRRAKPPPVTA